MRTELVTTLKRHATRILADLHESKDPVLITEHGAPSAYLVDVSVFEMMRDRMEILEGIARGERAILGGPDTDSSGSQAENEEVARLIWTEPALGDLEAVADYIALDNPAAACRFVERVFESVERLERFPHSGKRPGELPRSSYREVVVPPCRVFYRAEGDAVFLLHVMRAERLLRQFLLEERNRNR